MSRKLFYSWNECTVIFLQFKYIANDFIVENNYKLQNYKNALQVILR